MERYCVDCERYIGLDDDPTDGRCSDCDIEYLKGLVEESPRRRKSATKKEGE